MARIAKTVGALVAAAAALAGQAREFRFEARHDHLRKGGMGTLVVAVEGIRFEEAARHKHPHAWNWKWQDIQQLTVAPRRLTVLTYLDDPWRAGQDRGYRFDLPESAGDFTAAYGMLKDRLDQRFVAALPDPAGAPLWRMPVKRLLRFSGEQGTLRATARGLVFETGRARESRTWRWQDIENVSTAGPFELSIVTLESGFHFQLKERLEENRYDDLWRRVHAAKNVPILKYYERTLQP